jgi:hypothetical protein
MRIAADVQNGASRVLRSRSPSSPHACRVEPQVWSARWTALASLLFRDHKEHGKGLS